MTASAASSARMEGRRWAVPGSAHDRLVWAAKIVLPLGVGLLALFLAIAPLDKEGDASFILDKNKVDNAPERMRVEAARYVGTDDQGQRFEVKAQTALQRSSDVPIVDINGMMARLGLREGPVMIGASQGRYNLDTHRVAIDGPVRIQGPDDYRLATSDVLVDLKNRTVRSNGPVAGRITLGQFRAGSLSADLGERKVVLDGGVRLKIVQGAVR